jgi:hypothetical protein
MSSYFRFPAAVESIADIKRGVINRYTPRPCTDKLDGMTQRCWSLLCS